MAVDRNDNPEVIERDIQHTQDAMGDTVEQLEEKLNARTAAQSLLGDDAMDTARQAWSVARENPLPVALIAVGTAWLFATSQAPVIRDLRNRLIGGVSGSPRLRPRSEEPAPIGPPPATGEVFDRRPDA